MIKYFRELEDKESQYLVLIEESRFKSYNIHMDSLGLEFYQKYSNLFSQLLDLDVLYTKSLDNNQAKSFLNDNLYEGYDFEDFYSSYINKMDVSNYLTTEGKNRVDFLVETIKYNGKDSDYLHQYLLAILDLFSIYKNKMNWDKYSVGRYLSSVMVVAKYQNRLPNDMEELMQQALDEIETYKIEISVEAHKPINFRLPNSWYITPYNHLYNSMGSDGHKEANLNYPYYYTILRDHQNPNPLPYLKSIQRTKRNGFISCIEYEEYLNLKYDFPCIYPKFYYDLDSFSKIIYRHTQKRSYNPKLVNLIIGIESAHAGIYDFFYQLRQYSNDYERDIKMLKKLDLDEILVRCCGFHKVSSILDKTITTSCINYEDEFREYIEKGWLIDFIPPIILNKDKGIVEEYPEEFLTIRKILKSNRSR